MSVRFADISDFTDNSDSKVSVSEYESLSPRKQEVGFLAISGKWLRN